MAIRYNANAGQLGGALGRPETVQSSPQARGINPNVSFVKKQSYSPASKEPGKLPKWKKDLVESYKKLGIKPPSYIKKTRQQRENDIIQASLGTGTDGDPKSAIEDASGPDLYEICRKVSEAVITQEVAYEKPPTWPTATFGNDLPDEEEPWLVVQRVHEIVYINGETKEITREKFSVPLLESDGEVTEIVMTVEVVTPAQASVKADSRVSTALFNSTEAQAAITQANGEV